jgi:AcrR family transcriptional regulator
VWSDLRQVAGIRLLRYVRPVTGWGTDCAVAKEVGRPRHFEPEAERSMLIKATRRLLRREKYDRVTLAAILDESGLHTRAFYRHFQSKDDLLQSIYRENAEKLHRVLVARVEAAPSPAEAVAAWIDEILRLRFDPRSVAYVSIFDDPVAREAMESSGAARASASLIRGPLVRALAEARDDGTLPSAVPEAHAAFVSALVWNDLSWVPPGHHRDRWATARELLVSFVMSGLGRTQEPPRRSRR